MAIWRHVSSPRLTAIGSHGRALSSRWHSSSSAAAATGAARSQSDSQSVDSQRLSVDDSTAQQARLEIGASRRVVVKMGTAVVTHDGVEIALGRVTSIVEQLAHWQRRGIQPVLVSSGSIGLGATDLGFGERPRSLGMRQACAAVGQGHLINFYRQAFGQLGVKVAQVLLTNEDLADRDRALCFRTTMLRLIELGVVPILNENDSVSVRELLEADGTSHENTVFGDNDGLSARVATAIDADLLVLLTDVDGVFNVNPAVDPTATRLSHLEVEKLVDINTEEAAEGSTHGTGGMGSKVDAAVWACTHGVATLIANGCDERLVQHASS
jgi:glutamate 5-kinase